MATLYRGGVCRHRKSVSTFCAREVESQAPADDWAPEAEGNAKSARKSFIGDSFHREIIDVCFQGEFGREEFVNKGH